MGKYRSLVVKRKGIILAVLAVLCVLAIIFGARYVFAVDRTAAADEKTYVLFAANTSGMRCIQSDYSAFLILPPGNTIKVQVFERGKREAKLVTEGITVKYEVLNNTQPAAKNNFWQYAARYGYAAEPNIGITGNGLKGECVLSEDKKYYTASNIPVIPYNDDSDVRNPYQVAKITAIDNNSGKVIAEQKEIVLPVSDEMLCSTCHGKKNTDENILKAHDAHSHTRLFDDYKKGILYKCADCHKDNAIGLKGVPEALPFSQAMHGFHADKMSLSNIKPACYSCHPGPESQCYRGQMFAAEVPCDNADCHGSMVNVALTQKQGRQAWLQEVDCAKCHGQKYAVNEGQLFKNSFLLNAPNKEMSDTILCLSCHNSAHAEWESTLDADNALPIALQDYAGPIDKCTVCHKGKGKTHR